MKAHHKCSTILKVFVFLILYNIRSDLCLKGFANVWFFSVTAMIIQHRIVFYLFDSHNKPLALFLSKVWLHFPFVNFHSLRFVNDHVCRSGTCIESALTPTQVPDGRLRVKESTVSLHRYITRGGVDPWAEMKAQEACLWRLLLLCQQGHSFHFLHVRNQLAHGWFTP